MRGRKPHPTWRRQLDGNPGKRAFNREEPQLPPPPATFDDVPREIAAVPVAVAEWQRLAPVLREGGHVTDADRAALIALCLEWARYLQASDRVAASGLIVQTPNGYPIANPYLGVATKALAACARLWPELGLTPSSRSRVKAPPAADDPFTEFDAPPPRPTAH